MYYNHLSHFISMATLIIVLFLIVFELKPEINSMLCVVQLRWALARLRFAKYRNEFLESFAKGMGNVAAAIVYLILAMIVISVMR